MSCTRISQSSNSIKRRLFVANKATVSQPAKRVDLACAAAKHHGKLGIALQQSMKNLRKALKLL